MVGTAPFLHLFGHRRARRPLLTIDGLSTRAHTSGGSLQRSRGQHLSRPGGWARPPFRPSKGVPTETTRSHVGHRIAGS
jgi:hypothetical protein